MSDDLLSGVNLRKRFGKTTALDGVSISVASGEIVAVMGPSGSGKSTLLHCLAGILRPDAGEVSFDGQRIDELPEGARTKLRRTSFGFVFQLGQLVAELTLTENVALPLLLAGRPRREASAEAEGWLERLGVRDVAPRRPGEVSAGQAQRAAVARALVHDPQVVFADEPTGALDSKTAEEIMQIFQQLNRERGITIVLVTHEADIALHAKRLVRFKDGLIQEDRAILPHDDVMTLLHPLEV